MGEVKGTDLTAFIDLGDQIDEAEVKLAALKGERAEVEERLLEQFASFEGQKVGLKGRTVYVHRQLWATAKNGREAAAEALKEAGLDDLVAPNFNTNTVSARFREWDKADEDPPPELAEAFDVYEKFSVRAIRT